MKLPESRNVIDSKWVFKTKYNADGTVDRYKARVVARGFSQEPGKDIIWTFTRVSRLTSIRTLLAIANHLNLELHQMDVSTASLNVKLSEEIYMRQPKGYIQPGKEHLVYKLNNSIYGLKQASRSWFCAISEFFKENCCRQCKSDSCLYVK